MGRVGVEQHDRRQISSDLKAAGALHDLAEYIDGAERLTSEVKYLSFFELVVQSFPENQQHILAVFTQL